MTSGNYVSDINQPLMQPAALLLPTDEPYTVVMQTPGLGQPIRDRTPTTVGWSKLLSQSILAGPNYTVLTSMGNATVWTLVSASSMQAGANNTVLLTSGVGNVVWNAVAAANITSEMATTGYVLTADGFGGCGWLAGGGGGGGLPSPLVGKSVLVTDNTPTALWVTTPSPNLALLSTAAGGSPTFGLIINACVSASAAVSVSKLAGGVNNQVLTTFGTTPFWQTLADANISATAAIAVTKLAHGTNGQVLVTASGITSWSTITDVGVSPTAAIAVSKLAASIPGVLGQLAATVPVWIPTNGLNGPVLVGAVVGGVNGIPTWATIGDTSISTNAGIQVTKLLPNGAFGGVLVSDPSAGPGVRWQFSGTAGVPFLSSAPGSVPAYQSCYGNTVGVTASTVVVDSFGVLGTVVSSRRFKTAIEPLVDCSWIQRLNPVQFFYKAHMQDDGETLQESCIGMHKEMGFIAEEVDAVCPALVNRDQNGLPENVKYHALYAPLVSEIKRLQRAVDVLLERVVTLEAK